MPENIESRYRLVPMDVLIENYRFEQKFMELCRECANYGTNWACPPFDFDTEDYLRRYRYAHIFAVKWRHSADTIARNDTMEKAIAYSRALFHRGKEKMLTLLYRLEGQYAGSVGMSAGGCSICGRCSRFGGQPCIHPDKVRHSPEALGFDLTMISKDFLGIEILWGRDALPEYQVLLNALFTTEPYREIEREIRSYNDYCEISTEELRPLREQ